MQRRIMSSVCLWWDDVSEDYQNDELLEFYALSKIWLDRHCIENGFKEPNNKDLIRMANSGAFPNESEESVKQRYHDFTSLHEETFPKT